MSDNGILNEIDNVTQLTQSQKDRIDKSDLVKEELLDFVSATMKKISAEGSVKEQILQHIARKMTEEYEDISLRDLVKAYEVLSGSDNDLAKGLFEIIKGQQKIIVKDNHDDTPNNPVSIPENSLSKNEIGQVKDLLEDIKNTGEIIDYMEKIKSTEFNPDEKE